MKKIILFALALVLLGLCGCGEEPTPSPEEPGMAGAPTTGPKGEMGEYGLYPVSELDAIPGPDPFSLDDLEKRYGKPRELSAFPATGWIVALNALYVWRASRRGRAGILPLWE